MQIKFANHLYNKVEHLPVPLTPRLLHSARTEATKAVIVYLFGHDCVEVERLNEQKTGEKGEGGMGEET